MIAVGSLVRKTGWTGRVLSPAALAGGKSWCVAWDGYWLDDDGLVVQAAEQPPGADPWTTEELDADLVEVVPDAGLTPPPR